MPDRRRTKICWFSTIQTRCGRFVGCAAYLFDRRARQTLDKVDEWIRMVAINRLTGHSPGFFSVYTLPPNQAVWVKSQRKINVVRDQSPPRRDVWRLCLKKTNTLLADGLPPTHPPATLLTGPAHQTALLRRGEIDLVVTSPPFLNIVDYGGDNWLRCWFAGIDAKSVLIDRHKDLRAWELFVRDTFAELGRRRPEGWNCRLRSRRSAWGQGAARAQRGGRNVRLTL